MKQAETSAVDFVGIAQHRPRKCPTDPVAGPAGWQEAPAQCVWQGRLQMRRWQVAGAEAPASCVGRPAKWLAWQRHRYGLAPASPGAAWRSAWKSHAVAAGADAGRERIAIVETSGAGWTATEWTWSPSPRPASRAWQQARWDKLVKSASALRGADPAPNDAMLAVWERNLNGRAGEIGADGWRWESDGKCLRLTTLAAADIPLPLPYAREDARLEQRAAMQIRLARRYPSATFVAPFRMLDLQGGGRHAGAKYTAIWTERATVTGQIWIPLKNEERALRAQVVANLPARYDTPAGLAARSNSVRAIEQELASIATIWSATYER
ncbi:hypothetical protein [Massilia cavernae]|uniref:Uncharacterized protein n=1 Tax=Massilia cavernae TaxID=2320864 RepID=A0A418Y662_9BURK|nr:hypothetical protein [Massilia cavernae]RJG22859.1 hypothetical protein D3872_04985 [Massilia cavernae]